MPIHFKYSNFPKILFLLLFLVLSVRPSVAAEFRDMVHMKNGSTLVGKLIEDAPAETIKIRSDADEVLTIEMNKIEKIEKQMEISGDASAKKKIYRTWAREIKRSRRYYKSPRKALLFSLVPGGGQLYNRQYTKSAAMFGVFAGGAVCTILGNYNLAWPFQAAISISSGSGTNVGSTNKDNPINAWFYVGIGIMSCDLIWSLVDAPLSALKINRAHSYGHTLEFDVNDLAMGIDMIASQEMVLTKYSVHF